MMDHSRIETERIVDRYLVGRLPPDDEERFEEHLFECAECLEKVQAGEQMRRGLREVAAEEAARAVVAEKLRTLGVLAWLRQRSPGQLAGLASLAVAFVLLPVLVVRQQAEIAQLRSLATSPVSGRPFEPSGDFRVISLGVTRSATADVVVFRSSKTVLLSIELEEASSDHYQVTLLDESGDLLWRGEGLEPSLYDSLLVSLPPEFLEPGRVHLRVEAEGAGDSGLVSEFRLRIEP